MKKYLIVLLIIVVATRQDSPADVLGWPLPRRDAQRTGRAPISGLTKYPISQELFTFDVPEGARCHDDEYDVLISDTGEIFASCGVCCLWAYNSDGSLKWTLDITQKNLQPSVAVSISNHVLDTTSGALYATVQTSSATSGYIIKASAEDGTILWYRPFSQASPFTLVVPSTSQSRLLVLSIGKNVSSLLFLHSINGSLSFSLTLQQKELVIAGGPIGVSEDGKSVVVVTKRNEVEGSLFCIDLQRATPTIRWTISKAFNNLVLNGNVVVGMDSQNGRSYAYYLSNGTLVWSTEAYGAWFQYTDSLLGVGVQGQTYLAAKPASSKTVEVLAIDAKGTALWRSQVGPQCSIGSGLTLTNDTLFIMVCGQLYGLNSETGQPLWNLNISTDKADCTEWAPLDILIAPNGHLLVACSDRDKFFSKWHFFQIKEDSFGWYKDPGTLAGIIIGALVFLGLVAGLVVYLHRRQKKAKYHTIPDE